THSSIAQWTTGTNCQYTSNPKVGIGLSSCPTYNLVVNPSSSANGAQVLFGGYSFVGYRFASYANGNSVLVLQSPGVSLISVTTNIHAGSGDSDAYWFGTNSTYNSLLF